MVTGDYEWFWGGYGVVTGGYGWLRVVMGGNGVVIVDLGGY